MDELVKMVAKKANISEAQAKTAIDVVVDFLKERLPEPLDSQIENLLEGGEIPDDLIKGLGGLLGL